MPTVIVRGKGLLADLLTSVVKAFQPINLELEIDTVPCLPIPIPPDFGTYIHIRTILKCVINTFFYNCRFSHIIVRMFGTNYIRTIRSAI